MLEVFSDSDWAGNKSSRKSTSSGTMFLDGQVIYTFSRNQKSVALSSGEAEYYAGASAASDSILLKEAIQFLTGKRCKVNLYLDSSSARGIITRQGVGRVKHLQIRTLFLQELHKQGTLSVHPVGTKENTADIRTKPLSGKRIKLLLHWLGFQDENNEPVGREELQEHRSQEQARASVRMIKSKGNFAFAALLFSAISGISEGLFAGNVSGTVLQPEVGTVLCQDSMCSDMSACEQDRMCTDTTACALGLGTVCEAFVQEPCVHPQMLSLFKDLGQTVQELCASHSLEETGTSEEEEAATMTAVVAKELKDLMEKQGLNIRMLAEQIKELKGTVGTMTAEVMNMKTHIQELQQRWSEFIEEEEAARQEYTKYFEEQEKYKQELRADRHRLLEKEHRMEGHLGPTRSEIDEFSDRAYFDAMTKEQEAQEAMEESENEFYTQSFEYISEEEAGPQWQEEEEAEATGEEPKEPEKKKGQTQEEYDAERKELLAKARADIAAKEAKRKEQERGFTPPIDKSHDWKFYIDKEGNVWKQNYKTKEKIWWNYDYKYKHQKGKGKQEYEKAGKGHRPHEPFKPRDEEDAKYWERMGKLEEEKRRKREEEKAAAEEKQRKEQEARERLEKAAAEEEEKQKQKARETLEKAAEENERREAEEKARKAEAEEKARKAEAEEKARKAAAAEEKKKKAAAAAAEEEKKRKAAAAAEERKKMEEAEAEKRKEQEANKEKKRIEELEKELAELRGETRSETGSTKGARSEAGSTRGEEGKTEKQEQASSSDEDPELKGKGPPSQEKFMRGTPKFDEETDRNFYAVFPYDGNDYQWKWNSVTHFWYYFDLEQRRWHRQEGKDSKGKQTCLTQESRWNQMKGKMKGRGKGKGKEEEEENLAKHSPEYDYIEAGRQEAEGGGSSSTDFQ